MCYCTENDGKWLEPLVFINRTLNTLTKIQTLFRLNVIVSRQTGFVKPAKVVYKVPDDTTSASDDEMIPDLSRLVTSFEGAMSLLESLFLMECNVIITENLGISYSVLKALKSNSMN